MVPAVGTLYQQSYAALQGSTLPIVLLISQAGYATKEIWLKCHQKTITYQSFYHKNS